MGGFYWSGWRDACDGQSDAVEFPEVIADIRGCVTIPITLVGFGLDHDRTAHGVRPGREQHAANAAQGFGFRGLNRLRERATTSGRSRNGWARQLGGHATLRPATGDLRKL
jgi:hypothetical protein